MSVASGLYPLVLLSLGIGLLEFLLPGDRNSKTSSAWRAVAGLCILVAMLAPFAEGLSLLRALAFEDADGLRDRLEQSTLIPSAEPSPPPDALADRLAAAGAAEVEAWVYDALADTFGIPPANATVTARVTVGLSDSGDSARLEAVYISLSGSSALRDPHAIEAWFSDALGCPVLLSVG